MARTRAHDYEDHKESILAGAADLFARRGYLGTSMNDVAEGRLHLYWTSLAIVRAREMNLIGERNVAQAKATDLEGKKAELEATLEKLEADIKVLEARKTSLESNVAQIEGERNAAQSEVKVKTDQLEVATNSMYYEADTAANLKARGVLTTFNKVEKIADVKFASALNLKTTKSITFKPSQFGIDRIRDVRILPTYFKEKRELDVKFAEDGTVEVTVLNEAAMKGQKVLFVVER